MSQLNSFLHELLERADLVEIVGQVVKLKKTGANFVGLCPFHSERTPSFSVNPAKRFYYCFGCGKGGDAIDFLSEQNGTRFMETVRELAQRLGMEVPSDTRSAQDREKDHRQRMLRLALVDVLEQAANAYNLSLSQSARARDYFKARGVSSSIAAQFSLGYAPAGWQFLSTVFPNYDDPLLGQCGLVGMSAPESSDKAPRRWDLFRDRVIFPIRNVEGQVIGFGARVLGDQKPKYLNSPETPLFHKGSELYGLYEARKAIREQGFALVVEGYMDVVALAQFGRGNAVATLGTACTAEHVRKLFRFTSNIVFSFDGDSAGRKAARKALDAALPFASDTHSVKFLFLPPEHDPDSFIRAKGAPAFDQAVAEATPLSRFVIEAASQGCELSSAEGKSRFAANARPLWQALPQGLLREQILSDLATVSAFSPQMLLDSWSHEPGPRGSLVSTQGTPPQTHSTAPATGPRPQWALPSPRTEPRRKGKLFPVKPDPEKTAYNIARLLLRQTPLWESDLSEADHDLLAHQSGALGQFFGWFDRQFTDHGPQPLAALLAAAKETAFADLVERIMAAEELAPWNKAPSSNEGGLGPQPNPAANATDLRLLVLELKEHEASQLVNRLTQQELENPGNAQITAALNNAQRQFISISGEKHKALLLFRQSR